MLNQVYHDRQEEVVHSTTNYKIFSVPKENRLLEQSHVEKLYDAVQKKNLLREFPILVDSNFTVIDGQHRLKVAEAIGCPVYYIVSNRITVDDISETNANTRRWHYVDYLNRWCSAGLKDYLMLREFWEKYKFLTLSQSFNLCHYGNSYWMNRAFISGEYKCNDLEFAERVAKALLDLSVYTERTEIYKKNAFVDAYSNLMSNSLFSHKEMMKKMADRSRRLVCCTTAKEYIDLINEEIYNYNRKTTRVELRQISPNEESYREDRKTKV